VLAFPFPPDSQAEPAEIMLKPEPEPWNGLPFHIRIKLPGYGAMIYRPVFRRKNRE
jgi:hypothetical protein